MLQNATSIKSIKFYCSVPKIQQGQLQGTEIKATYHTADGGSLTFSVDTGPSGVLTVNVGGTVYLYKLADILGRIEVQQ